MPDIPFTRLQPTNSVVPTPIWFIIKSGVHTGRLHLAGWKLSAISSAPGTRYPDGRPREFYGIAHCPRCSAMVCADSDDLAYGDLTGAHEQWHAATDYPIPEELLRETRKDDE